MKNHIGGGEHGSEGNVRYEQVLGLSFIPLGVALFVLCACVLEVDYGPWHPVLNTSP